MRKPKKTIAKSLAQHEKSLETMGKPWKNHKKNIRQKPLDNHGKNIRKPLETTETEHRKTMANNK